MGPSPVPPRRPQSSRVPTGLPGIKTVVTLLLLLLLPSLALYRLSEGVDWRLLAGGVTLVSLSTWFLYRSDKRKAQAGAWRTPESTLHLAGLIGGWAAAFLAQRRFRHKIAKKRFQIFYWAIVFLHQFAALDYLRGWQLSLGVWRLIRHYH